jgi:hypothetical protein
MSAEFPELRDFQIWMQTFIVSSGTPEQALESAERTSGFSEGSAQRLVKRSPTLTEMERLMIYRRMYPLRMEEALSIDFPACRKLLGSKVFSGLVEDYVEAHPSTSWTLDHLGRHLVSFVREHPLAVQYPGLYDLVRLEQALCEVFNELDAPVLGPEALAAVGPDDWPEVRLALIPAFRLLDFQSNANEVYKAYNQDRVLPSFRSDRSYLVVWRQHFQTWRMPVAEAAHGILDDLLSGRSLGQALADALERSVGLEDSQVFAWFSTWVNEGFFTALHLPEPLPEPENLHPQ